ncbi:L-asparaginase II [Pedococcus dokdonensis]|uniref:L-asparaginase II n=1 Tax=Pedococcus dokdonensis TaxID=443156 RepID=A0A1H0RCG6_9MICO|nr:asparaginase [Pedococcus dokdonensis]SDP27227.1 L-asparaginase II [Pedococcus dokdonensis]
MVATPAGPFAELAVVTRSGMVESRHYGSLVAMRPDGSTALALGTADAPVLPRSTAKPFQAVACLAVGTPLDGPELAIAAGSHTGQDEHVRVVRALLDRAGLDEDALGCPPDRPEDQETYERLVREGVGTARIRMNCSGKHAAMLLACATNGWPTRDYLDADHPLQREVRLTVAELTGLDVTTAAVDGCGAPLFSTSVRGLARAFGSLVLAEPGSPGALVADAMRAHPLHVGGTGQANTTLMTQVPGALAKGGAEGVIGVAGPDGAAVAMKVVDGSPRATTVIALHVLQAMGADVSQAGELTEVAVLGGGAPVGRIQPGADLERALATLEATR